MRVGPTLSFYSVAQPKPKALFGAATGRTRAEKLEAIKRFRDELAIGLQMKLFDKRTDAERDLLRRFLDLPEAEQRTLSNQDVDVLHQICRDYKLELMSEHTWELREYLQGSSNIPEAGRTALQRFIGLSWQDLQDLNRFSDDDVDTAFMLFQHMLQALDEADQARDAAHALAWQAVLRGRHGTTG